MAENIKDGVSIFGVTGTYTGSGGGATIVDSDGDRYLNESASDSVSFSYINSTYGYGADCDDGDALIDDALDGTCDGDGDGYIDSTAGGSDYLDNDPLRVEPETSCLDIYNFDNSLPNGDYEINITGLGLVTVYCDMEGGAWTWPYDTQATYNYTKLLLQSNTTISTDLVVDVANNHSIIENSQHSTTQFKFGQSSFDLTGTADYITILDSTDWTLGTNDFTIDFWIYPTSFSSWNMFLYFDSEILQMMHTGTTSSAHQIGSTNNYRYGDPLTLNTWNHLALVRSGNNFSRYINGNLVYSEFNSDSLGDPTQIRIGPAYSGWGEINAYFDEVRIINGYAAWNSSFTPPNLPFRFK